MEQQGKGRKHVKWDEEALKETEKCRGTFQKIDEPKTPYRHNSESDEQMEPQTKSAEEIALEKSLKAAKVNSRANHHKKVNITELNQKLMEELKQYQEREQMEDEEEEAARKKREEFKKKRAQHYNEFQMIQQMRQKQWEDDQE